MRIKHENFVNEIEVVSYTSTQANEQSEDGTLSPIENTFDVVVTDPNGDQYGFRVFGNVEEELAKLAV